MGLAEVKQFFQPETPRGVVELLSTYGHKALILGGGTFVHGLAARGLVRRVEALIDLQKVGLSYVRSEDNILAIGAMTTFADLAEAGPAKSLPELGAVWDALAYPPAQIRNMATVGGSVAAASPLFDLPIALIALDGTLKALGPRGFREIEFSNFYLDYFEHVLEKGEFLVEVQLPKWRPRSASAFLKLETNANDLALFNVAVRITLDDSGLCQDARVVAGGGVGKIPVRAVSCERVLERRPPTPELLRECEENVSTDIHPISDHRASAQYRSAVAKVFVRRALNRALARLGVELG